MKKQKSILSLLLAIVFTISLSSCTGDMDEVGGTVNVPGNGKWVDSNMRGEITAESTPRLQDDFAAASNKEYILSLAASTDKDIKSIEILDNNMKDKYIEVINDDTLNAKYAQELRKFVDLAKDDELRNSQGIEPLRPYLDAITEITSVNELIEYEKDLEKNPFGLNMISESFSTVRYETTDTPVAFLNTMEYTLESANEYTNIDSVGMNAKKFTDGRTEYLLTRFGFDKKNIEKIIKGCYHIESLIAEADTQKSDINIGHKNYTRSEIEKMCDNYPCLDILKSRSAEYELFQVDASKLAGINKLYNSQNLDDIKSYYIVHLLRITEMFLDHEALVKLYDRRGLLNDTSKSTEEVIETSANRLILSYITQAKMQPALDQAWIDKYYDQRAVDDVKAIAADYIDYYRELLNNTEWLSEETRNMAIKKLDNIVLHVGKTSIAANYDSCNIKTKDEGGSFIEACAESFRYCSEFQRQVVSLGESRENWEPYSMSITECNAFYDISQNAVFIMWGMLQEPVYSPDMEYEEKLATLGCFIGHEMTHAFDTTGAKTDHNGVIKTWMSMEDNSVFREKSSKVASYYSMITPFSGVMPIDGNKVANEQIADLGGIKGALSIAKKSENFDYDKFFRAYAHFYAGQISREMEKYSVTNDEHPLDYLRINVGLQQFDEFIKTYDIKPGDGMYLAPENRICVW
ncbi:MAG: M13 family metallopeptidase [Clostridia bacterium]|nr:M13 family metallopeptidase [Clostridia bacterium]